MEQEPKIVEYPLWRVAVEKIKDVFEEEGYGTKITHTTLRGWMAIPEPVTIDAAKKADLDYLSGMGSIKQELLCECNLCLYSVPGVGYEILHPMDQVRKGAEKFLRQSAYKLSMSGQVLANINTAELDAESRRLQLLKINRVGFIKAAFLKRKIPDHGRKMVE